MIRAVGVETGGSNIQFARERETGELRVIEMNPRVSRSSALASKATGLPDREGRGEARGRLHARRDPERPDGTTPASFEPTLDYVVVKFPRFAFEKFPGADETLGTQMKSVGEAMGIGRTFTEAFLKAMRSARAATPWATLDALPDGVHPGSSRSSSARKSALVSRAQCRPRRRGLAPAKALGWSEPSSRAGHERGRRARAPPGWGVRPAYRRVDSCAAEVEARSNYLYSTWGEADEAPPGSARRVVILGSGPNRIGQGIEFDYCCVHAAKSVPRARLRGGDGQLQPGDGLDRLRHLRPPLLRAARRGGGARDLRARAARSASSSSSAARRRSSSRGLSRRPATRSSGRPFDAVDLAEDRERFAALCGELGIPVPPWGAAAGQAEAVEIAEEIGYPVLVRPSYVLGGRQHAGLLRRRRRSEQRPRARGAFSSTASSRGRSRSTSTRSATASRRLVAAVMEHVEEAGVHSGDSSCVLPPPSLTPAALELVEATVRTLAPALGVVGLVNVQLAVVGDELYVLEANPRASRTVPFASKAIGVNLVEAACRLAGGPPRRPGARARRRDGHVSRQGGRLPVRPLPGRRPGARAGDALDRRGDGERRGLPLGDRQGRARRGRPLPEGGTAFLSVRDSDKDAAVELGSRLVDLGFELCATAGTAHARRRGPAGHERAQGGGGRATARPSSTSSAGVAATSSSTRRRRGRALGRLPDPRGGARRPRSLHHDLAGRVAAVEAIARARSEDRPVPPGASCEENCLTSSGSRTSAPTGCSASSAGGSSPGIPGQFFMLPARAPAAAADEPLPRDPHGELGFLIDPIGPGTRALCASSAASGSTCSGRSAMASGSTSSGRCSSAAGSGSRRSLPLRAPRRPPAVLGFRARPTPRRRRSSRMPRWSSSRAS